MDLENRLQRLWNFQITEGQKHMLWAAFLFSIMGVLVKFLNHIPVYELVFFRSVITFICCVGMLWGGRISPWGVNRPVLILRGLAGTLGLYLFFYTLQILPLASAVSIQFLSPIFTIFIAGIFLKEPASFRQWIFFVTAFLGVVMIKGFDSRISTEGLIYALIGAFGSAMAYNFVRVLKKTDHPLVIILYFSIVTIPIMGPISFLNWVWPRPVDWLWIAVLGLCVQFAQLSLTKALHLEKAANVTHLKYLSLVYALLFGFFLFGESIPFLALLGMGLIVGSVILANRVRKP